MIRELLRILGVLEDIEMADGTGSRLLIKTMEKSLWLGTNIQLYSLELS